MDGEGTKPSYNALAERTQVLLAQSATTNEKSGALLGLIRPTTPVPVVVNDEMDEFFNFQDACQSPDRPESPLPSPYYNKNFVLSNQPPQSSHGQPVNFEQSIFDQHAQSDNTPEMLRRPRCPIEGCGKSFVSDLVCEHHVRGIHNHEFDCPVCEVARHFSSPQNTEGHLYSWHSNGWPFVCVPCRKAFLNQARMDNHSHSFSHKYVIDQSQQEVGLRDQGHFTLQSGMHFGVTEQEYHTPEQRPPQFPEGQAPSTMAGQSYFDKSDFPEANALSKINDDDATMEPHKSTLECCGKSFLTLKGYRNHIRGMHNHEFDCPVCCPPLSLCSQQYLERHIWKLHRKNWRWLCGNCKMGFTEEYRLINHLTKGRHLVNLAVVAPASQARTDSHD